MAVYRRNAYLPDEGVARCLVDLLHAHPWPGLVSMVTQQQIQRRFWQVLFKLHLWCKIPMVKYCSIHHYTRLFKTMFFLFSVFNHTKVMILWSAVQIFTFCSVVELLKTALFEWSVKVNNCQTTCTLLSNHHTCMYTGDWTQAPMNEW